MTKLTFDDISEKTIPADSAWHIQVKSPQGYNKEFDTQWANIKPLFCGNVPKINWYKLTKDTSGKWGREQIPPGDVQIQEEI